MAAVMGPKGHPHFRAHPRRPLRITVELRLVRAASPASLPASLRDVSLAGAGLELDDATWAALALAPGERLAIAIATPTLWDPLVVRAVVAWSNPPRDREPARVGLRFEHEGPSSVLATWEMLSALEFD